MTSLSDRFGRHFQYLRLSLTDACNFKCKYCLPHGYQKGNEAEPLSRAEISNLVSAFAELGTFKVRLTGGEPTLRKDLIDIVSDIHAIPGITKIALSTNGTRLNSIAHDLKLAGLNSINVSIDSLHAATFAEHTGLDRLDEVQMGVKTALGLSFAAIKINAVLMKQTYREEFERFETWVKENPVTVRFIELMPTGSTKAYFEENHVSSLAVKEELLARGWMKRARDLGDGPAEEWSHPNFRGRLGVIAPYGKEFCSTCNRLRVSARGELKLCLFAESNQSVRHFLQAPSQKEELKKLLVKLIAGKDESHYLPEGRVGNNFSFSSIGG